MTSSSPRRTSRGRLTYCNRIFIEFSGFTEKRIAGIAAQHHPSSRHAAWRFQVAVGYGIQGDESFAYVKNMSKDGGFTGWWPMSRPTATCRAISKDYFSAAQTHQGLSAAPTSYRSMLDEENRAGPRDACAASLAMVNGILTQKGLSYASNSFSL